MPLMLMIHVKMLHQLFNLNNSIVSEFLFSNDFLNAFLIRIKFVEKYLKELPTIL